MPATSVIVSTFNRPGHLLRCFEGLRHQSAQDFELLVADDGSATETAEAVREAAKSLPFPVQHVWQPDEGFRKCRILNQAVRLAASDHLIFSDGDCVPHRHFVAAHLRHRAPGQFLVGRMVKWGPARSAGIDREAIARGRHARVGPRDLWENLRGQHRNLPYGIYLPGNASFRLVQRIKKNRNARGCNLSIWKRDLEDVNGWNEDFESWGLEDVELGYRLRLAGIEPMLIINRACTFHLYHDKIDRASSRSARQAYDASKARGRPWCPNGLLKRSEG